MLGRRGFSHPPPLLYPIRLRLLGLTFFGMDDSRQGIVHVIGPEQGFTLPGTTLVCGDSHTATHGAFGALAFGIGTSEVEHVLATQTLVQKKAKNLCIQIDGELPPSTSGTATSTSPSYASSILSLFDFDIIIIVIIV